MTKFGAEIINDLNIASSLEWLATNGLGGFSTSTIIGLNTRRYHGLLTAATKPPVGRILMLSKLEETLVIGGRRYELSANQYPGVVHPNGFRFQTRFELNPFPIFTFEVEGQRLNKSVFMPQGENTVIVQYHFEGKRGERGDSVTFEVRPLIAFRDYHSTTHENPALIRHVEVSQNRLTIKPYSDLPALNFAHEDCTIDTNSDWYRNFQYLVEQERGLDFAEDLFNPFTLTFDLTQNPRVRIVASTEDRDVNVVVGSEIAVEESLVSRLKAAADQFIVSRGNGKTVIAGYHWFSDWGRDTMIALPGLLLTTKQYDIAKSVLLEFAKHVDRGMLPNRFPDAGETPEYNTVDATLWFFEASSVSRTHP